MGYDALIPDHYFLFIFLKEKNLLRLRQISSG